MPPPWPITLDFDGTKFASRYNLNATGLQPDFHREGNLLYLRAGLAIPDDPPILEPPDPPEITRRAGALKLLTELGTNPMLTRALALTALDAINQIRGALVPPLPPITRANFTNAIRAKITAGDTDT